MQYKRCTHLCSASSLTDLWCTVSYSQRISKNGMFFLPATGTTGGLPISIDFFSFDCLVSNGLYSWKLRVFSWFSREASPPRMNTSPGTRKEQPRQVSPEGTSSSPRMWQIMEVSTISNLEAILMISSENICLTRILVMMRVSPSKMETYNTLTKLVQVYSPNTPNLVLKENSLPPKKYPNVIKLNVRKMLQMKRQVNRGISGRVQKRSRQKLANDPKMASPSPRMSLFHGSICRYFQASGLCTCGIIIESASTSRTPSTAIMAPPTSNS